MTTKTSEQEQLTSAQKVIEQLRELYQDNEPEGLKDDLQQCLIECMSSTGVDGWSAGYRGAIVFTIFAVINFVDATKDLVVVWPEKTPKPSNLTPVTSKL